MNNDTHEAESVCVWVARDVPGQIPAGHPAQNELEGSGGGTQKGDDVWMCQVFPYHSYLIEGLWGFVGARE